MLAQLGVFIAADTFGSNDKFHIFNRFINSLEELRRALNVVDENQVGFYIALLGVPIRDRPGYVLNQARQIEGVLRFEFVKAFSAANAVLMGGAR